MHEQPSNVIPLRIIQGGKSELPKLQSRPPRWASTPPYRHRTGAPNHDKVRQLFESYIVGKYEGAFFHYGTANISDAMHAQLAKIRRILHEAHMEMAILNVMLQQHDEARRTEIQAKCDARNPAKDGR